MTSKSQSVMTGVSIFAILVLVVGSILALAFYPNLANSLPPAFSHVATPGLNQLRSALDLPVVPFHPIWHNARALSSSHFEQVKLHYPGAKVNFAWHAPLIAYFDNVLTEEQIDLLLNRAEPMFTKSKIVGEDGLAKEDESRTSETAWLYPENDKDVRDIIARLTMFAGFPASHAEAVGVNRYRKKQYFRAHYDYISEDYLNNPDDPFRGCQRAATILAYLSDVEKGGDTVFVRNGSIGPDFTVDPNNPDHLTVKPKRGRVLVWFNMHPFTETVDERTLHGGSPVSEGTKIAATIFVRNCSIRLSPKEPASGTHEDL